MTNFRDPAVISKDEYALLKLAHVVNGIFIWDFVTTLGFEWSVIQGRRPYRWTFWIYSLARVAGLTVVITNLLILNSVALMTCQVSIKVELITTSLALSSASLLLVLRIFAIWKKNILVLTIITPIWGVGCAFPILGIFRIREGWDPSTSSCMVPNIQTTKVTMIVAFVTDVLLLGIMLIGLLRLGYHRQSSWATGRFLLNQGVIWLILAIVAGVIPTVFVCLNLNGSYVRSGLEMSMMFEGPWLITVSMASTRMYRSLRDFMSSNTHSLPYEASRSTGSGGTIRILGSRGAALVPSPLKKIEVHTYTTQERSLTSQMSYNNFKLGTGVENLMSSKPHEAV